MISHPNWSAEGQIFIPYKSGDKYTSIQSAFNKVGYSPHIWELSWRDPPEDVEFGLFCSQWVRKIERSHRYPRFHLDLMGPKVISINGAQVISAKIRIHLDVSRHTKGKSGFDVEKCSKEVTKLELALRKQQI